MIHRNQSAPGLLLLVVMSQGFFWSKPRSSSTLLSFFMSRSRSLSFSLDLSLSLCFLDFFFDLPCREGWALWVWDPSRLLWARDVEPRLSSCVVEWGGNEGGWLSLSATAASWLSQSLPLESLLTSERGSKGRWISSKGNWELDDVSADCELDESFPLDELSLPFMSPVDLLARCDILGFLLARGSMNSVAGRFCWIQSMMVRKIRVFKQSNIK